MKLIIFLLLFLSSLIYSQSLWESTSFPDSIPVLSLAFDSSSNIIYAGTNTHGIYKSTNDGMTWIEINNGISGYKIIRDLLVINSQKVFAATENGLYKSTNQGVLWESINVGTNAFGYLTTSPKGDIFTGTWGGIYRSTDEGENWEKIFNTGQDLVQSISFDSKCTIYSHISGDIYRSFDYGLSWQRIGDLRTGSTHHSINSGVVTNNDNILFGTYDGGIFFSSDYGSTFEPKNTGLNYLGISELLVDEGDHISVITFPKGYYTSIDEADKWNSFGDGLGNDEPMTLTTDSKGYFYLGSYYGGIYRSKFTLFRFLPKERTKKYYKHPNTVTMDSILIKK
ncbi:MAG: hypothetical protein IPJ23_06055 [Ignavibacteriales bacterium]|nr:hypothetical protein [Ignavibacteriales bacterium]